MNDEAAVYLFLGGLLMWALIVMVVVAATT